MKICKSYIKNIANINIKHQRINGFDFKKSCLVGKFDKPYLGFIIRNNDADVRFYELKKTRSRKHFSKWKKYKLIKLKVVKRRKSAGLFYLKNKVCMMKEVRDMVGILPLTRSRVCVQSKCVPDLSEVRRLTIHLAWQKVNTVRIINSLKSKWIWTYGRATIASGCNPLLLNDFGGLSPSAPTN